MDEPLTAHAASWAGATVLISSAEGLCIAHGNLGLPRSMGHSPTVLSAAKEKKGTWAKAKLAKRRIAKPRLSINQFPESHETGN